MITAMNLFLVIIVAAAVLAFSYLGLYLVAYIGNDGARRAGRANPPRSHEPDMFDPAYRHTRHA